MSNDVKKVYLAGGWFSPDTREILNNMETILSNKEFIDLYSPRRDGIMLTPYQKHDTSVREKIFKENIINIIKSDVVIANIYSEDFYNDPGTMYEIGYAMSNNIPVIGFSTSANNITERFKGIISGFDRILIGYPALEEFLERDMEIKKETNSNSPKILLVGAGEKSVDEKLATYILDSGFNIRWIDNTHDEIYPRINEIFDDVDFMVAVVDDRKTLVSWMIGQAYSRKVPVITYSDYNYGINVMLLVSILTHIRGTEEFNRFLQQVKREGLNSIPPFDISTLESC